MSRPGWKKETLGDLLSLQRGYDLPGHERAEGNVPVYGSFGITGYHDTARAQAPGLTVGRSGASFGVVNYVPRPFWPHNAVLFATDFKGNNPRYLYYLLKTIDFSSLNSGSAQPSLNRNYIYPVRVATAPKNEQTKIASALAAYDDLIENNTRRIAILEEMARALYREWFIEFRFPGHEGQGRKGSRPQDGWRHGKLGDFINLVKGKSYRSNELSDEGGLPFVNLKCFMRDGGFRRDGIKCFVGDHKESHRASRGDILMAVTDMTQERRIIARAARMPRLSAPIAVMSMDVVKLSPRDPQENEYFYAMLRFSPFADEVKQHANGATVLHLNPARIHDYVAGHPPPDLARRFSRLLRPMLELSDTLADQTERLKATRDLLLPRLISGELDVSRLPDPGVAA